MMIAILNGTHSDIEVTKVASRLSKETKEKLSLVYVIRVPRNVEVDREISSLTERAEETLERMEKLSRNMKTRPVSQIILSRFIGSAVVSHAIEERAKTIVIALPPKFDYVESYLLNESLEYVLKHAPCSVITCRPSLSAGSNPLGRGG